MGQYRKYMKTIWKIETPITDRFSINIPIGSEILCVKMQNDIPCIWFLCNSDNPREERYLELFGTGNEIHTDMGIERKYIGTYEIKGFVGHLFERIN